MDADDEAKSSHLNVEEAEESSKHNNVGKHHHHRPVVLRKRVVALLGLDGCGKTRLLGELAKTTTCTGNVVVEAPSMLVTLPTRPLIPSSSSSGSSASSCVSLFNSCNLAVMMNVKNTATVAHGQEGQSDEKTGMSLSSSSPTDNAPMKKEDTNHASNAPPSPSSRLQLEMIDCSGYAPDRVLWKYLLLDESSGNGGHGSTIDHTVDDIEEEDQTESQQNTTTSRTVNDNKGGDKKKKNSASGYGNVGTRLVSKVPSHVDGFTFVIDGHDIVRAPLAWSEFVNILRSVSVYHFKPVLVVVVRHRRSQMVSSNESSARNADPEFLDAAQLLRLVEDQVLSSSSASSGHWDIIDVDLSGGGGGGGDSENGTGCGVNTVTDWFLENF